MYRLDRECRDDDQSWTGVSLELYAAPRSKRASVVAREVAFSNDGTWFDLQLGPRLARHCL